MHDGETRPTTSAHLERGSSSATGPLTVVIAMTQINIAWLLVLILGGELRLVVVTLQTPAWTSNVQNEQQIWPLEPKQRLIPSFCHTQGHQQILRRNSSPVERQSSTFVFARLVDGFVALANPPTQSNQTVDCKERLTDWADASQQARSLTRSLCSYFRHQHASASLASMQRMERLPPSSLPSLPSLPGVHSFLIKTESLPSLPSVLHSNPHHHHHHASPSPLRQQYTFQQQEHQYHQSTHPHPPLLHSVHHQPLTFIPHMQSQPQVGIAALLNPAAEDKRAARRHTQLSPPRVGAPAHSFADPAVPPVVIPVPTQRRPRALRESADSSASVVDSEGVDGEEEALAQSPRPKKKRKARICKTDGCEKYVVDRGLCIRHGVRLCTAACVGRLTHLTYH